MQGRKEDRKFSYSKILFLRDMVPGYIRDLSLGGFRSDLLQKVEWQPGEHLEVQIIPHEETAEPAFLLAVEIRWKKNSVSGCSLGIKIVNFLSPGGKSIYEKLLNFYSFIPE